MVSLVANHRFSFTSRAYEPQVFLHVKGILEAGVGKAGNGFIRVVHTLDDTGACELMDNFLNLLAGNAFKHKFCNAGFSGLDLNIAVNVTVGVTGNGATSR